MSAVCNDSPTGFDNFGLDSTILRGVRAAGFTEPRAIQRDTVPAAVAGRDVLGLAQTGTGKTAAFALPLLQRLYGRKDGRRDPRALVLAPTRELANQIDAEFRALARFTGLTTATVYGGVSAPAQIKALRRRPDIIVGCPGRVLDLLGRGVLRLNRVETVVLDEADHMFDMGFLPDVRRILKACPGQRQNLLFSATMPREIRALADAILRDPEVVELALRGPAETIDHALVAVREDRKRDLLERILSDDGCESAIVFTRTKHRARRLARQLDQAGHRAVGLQGNMSQSQRTRAMQGFRQRRFDVLVATDIAARGIDVHGVSHVINFDVPNTPDAYTHRIGRTGRAERDGLALTFVTRDDVAWLRATERQLGASILRRTVDGFESEALDGPARRPDGRARGSRARGRVANRRKRGNDGAKAELLVRTQQARQGEGGQEGSQARRQAGGAGSEEGARRESRRGGAGGRRHRRRRRGGRSGQRRH